MTRGSSFIAGNEFGGGKIEFWDFLAKSTFPWNGQKSLLLITYFIYSQCSSCAHGWTDEDTKVVPSLKSICQSLHSLILLRFQTILNWIIFFTMKHMYEKRGKGVQHNTSNIGFHQVFLFCFSCSFGDGWHSPCRWFFKLRFPPIVVVEVSHCFVGVTVRCTSIEVINTCVRCRQTQQSTKFDAHCQKNLKPMLILLNIFPVSTQQTILKSVSVLRVLVEGYWFSLRDFEFYV